MKVSWAKKQIAILQLNVQKDLMERTLLQIEVNLRPESGKEALALRDELRKELEFLREARREVESLPARRKKPWSKFVVALYLWATKGRFDF